LGVSKLVPRATRRHFGAAIAIYMLNELIDSGVP
jgi:hypothetical protein